MFEIFNIILQMSFKASIVIIAILIVRFFLKRAPKKFSYMLWSVAAFRLLMPFSFESFFSIFRFTKGFAEKNIAYTPNSNIVPNIQNTPNFNTNVTQPHIQTIPNTQRPLGEVSNIISDVPVSDVTAQTISEEIDIVSVIGNIAAWIWIIGMTALVIYGIVSYIKLKRRMDNAVLFENNVFLSDRVSSPFTLGFIKPRIYLPFGLSETETKCILAHEKAHIKRLDHIVKPISFLLLSVHWFNPLCWIAFNRMAFDMEMSCDEAVLQKSNDVEIKKNYSRTLLALASKQRFPAMSPIAFNDGGSAKSRINHTLGWKKPKVWISVIAVIICIVTLVACLSDYTSGRFDFDGEPYILEYSSNGDGTCYVSNIFTNFEYENSFEIVIPEKSPDDDTVIGIKIAESNALNNFERFNVPKYILAEDMNKIIDAINAFDGETLDIIQNEKSTERVSKIFLTFYALHKAPDNNEIEYYLIDKHITKEEHERLSAILMHYAEYDAEDCFEDSEKCLEEITGFENLEGRVFDFFYHSAQNIEKIIIPKTIEIIEDGIDKENGLKINYEHSDSVEKLFD